MEQAIIKNGKRSGWSEKESSLLWETADEAQQQGLPLKQVFEHIAEMTGRRPNSIRNYYYAQVRQREDGQAHTARFIPFAEDEVASLMEHVLRARAQGQSVRSCLQQMAGGDHSLMLRYQNKYRSVLKSRPELVHQLVNRLNEEGVSCQPPEVRQRSHATLDGACIQLSASAKKADDGELIRACETLTRLILNGRSEPVDRKSPEQLTQMDRMGVKMDLYRMALTERTQAMTLLSETAGELTGSIKEYLALEPTFRKQHLTTFCNDMAEKIGRLEERITESEAFTNDQFESNL